MKICVTGACGNLGQGTCARLLEAGHEVLATDLRYVRGLPATRQRMANLLEPEIAYELVEGMDAVVHLGNHPHILGRCAQRVFGENGTINANVFAACADLGVPRVIYASSVQVFGSRRQSLDAPSLLPYLPADGELPLIPGNPYAASKAAGELLLQGYCAEEAIPTALALRFPHLIDRRLMERALKREYWTLGPGGGGPMPSFDECGAFLPLREGPAVIEACLTAPVKGYHALLPAMRENRYGLPVAEVMEKLYPGVPHRKPVDDSTGLVDLDAVEFLIGYRPPSLEDALAAEAGA